MILLLFLLQQFYMIIRMTLRLTLYSSQMHLYQGVNETKTIHQPQVETELGTEGAQA